MSHPHNPHPHNPDAQGCTEIVIQPSPEANDSRPASCSGLCSQDTTETLPDIAQAFMDRDWCRFALLVSGAPEIEKPGKAHFAMREIAIAAIERLKYEEQETHLQAVTDYAMIAERDIRRI